MRPRQTSLVVSLVNVALAGGVGLGESGCGCPLALGFAMTHAGLGRLGHVTAGGNGNLEVCRRRMGATWQVHGKHVVGRSS